MREGAPLPIASFPRRCIMATSAPHECLECHDLEKLPLCLSMTLSRRRGGNLDPFTDHRQRFRRPSPDYRSATGLLALSHSAMGAINRSLLSTAGPVAQ